MGKRVFVLGSCLSCTIFLFGCSMMPNDEEIINWSITESEIFDEETILKVEDNQEINENFDDINQEWIEEDWENEDDEGNNVDVEFEVAN